MEPPIRRASIASETETFTYYGNERLKQACYV